MRSPFVVNVTISTVWPGSVVPDTVIDCSDVSAACGSIVGGGGALGRRGSTAGHGSNDAQSSGSAVGSGPQSSEVGAVDDAEILAAALLHDTVEDTAATHEAIRERFSALEEARRAEHD